MIHTMNKKPSQALVGRRIRLIKCNDTYSVIQPGSEGIVDLVDDVGTVFVKWDNGGSLGLVWEDGDRWIIVQ